MDRDAHTGNADADHDHQQDEVRDSFSPGRREEGALSPSADEGTATGDALGSEEMEPFNNNIPVFLDRTFRMIENVSNDIVCWSEAGDSFIIKQASKQRERDSGREPQYLHLRILRDKSRVFVGASRSAIETGFSDFFGDAFELKMNSNLASKVASRAPPARVKVENARLTAVFLLS